MCRTKEYQKIYVTEYVCIRENFLAVMEQYENAAEAIRNVYSSFISNEISSVYYSNPDYIKCSYEAGMLLD